jgi:hypothetical protein
MTQIAPAQSDTSNPAQWSIPLSCDAATPAVYIEIDPVGVAIARLPMLSPNIDQAGHLGFCSFSVGNSSAALIADSLCLIRSDHLMSKV